jgi:hypothetical protein
VSIYGLELFLPYLATIVFEVSYLVPFMSLTAIGQLPDPGNGMLTNHEVPAGDQRTSPLQIALGHLLLLISN